MQDLLLSRRQGLVLAAAGSASALMGAAVAQTARGGGDWLAMIKEHHGLIARALQELVESNEQPFEQRDLQLRTVTQLLNAHSLAEESVIYPALVRAGLQRDAEKFYMDEAQIKIALAALELEARKRQAGGPWRDAALGLQKTVLAHARDEETGQYPQLHQKLGTQDNQLLTQLYAGRFSSVVPAVNR